jgi:hypothetical protein
MEGGFSGRVGGWRRRIEEAGSRPPKMVLWVNAGAAMCATPVFIVEGLRYRRQVATTDTAFDQQLAPELVGARRLFDRQAVELAGRGPDPNRAIDLMVPNRPLFRPPLPRHGQFWGTATPRRAPRGARAATSTTQRQAPRTTSATSVRSRSVLASRVPRFGLASSIVGLRLCGE